MFAIEGWRGEDFRKGISKLGAEPKSQEPSRAGKRRLMHRIDFLNRPENYLIKTAEICFTATSAILCFKEPLLLCVTAC